MGRKCCVYGCNGNYDKNNVESTFRLPSNEEERNRWIQVIPRDNIPDRPDTVVCERHWIKPYPIVIYYGKPRPRDPPTEFDCVKKSLTPTPPPLPRTTKSALPSKRSVQGDELSTFLEKDKIHSLEQIQQNISSVITIDGGVVCFRIENSLMIQSGDYMPETCVSRFNLRIFHDFSFESFHCGIKCTITPLSRNMINLLTKWSIIEEAVRYLNAIEIDQKKAVLIQQMQSMKPCNVGHKKYSADIIVRAFQYFATSRATYHLLRNDYELPSIQTLTRLTSKVKNINDVSFLQNVFSSQDEKRKTCILLVDEVYVKPMLQYHGGSLFGKAQNNPDKLANTVVGFMIVSLFGGIEFVYKMLPINGLDANFLFEQCNIIVSQMRNLGGKIVSIICDGNRTNQSFFKKFDLVSPWLTSENIVLLYDYVHLMKSVRNNWITEKCGELEFKHGDQKMIARWNDLRSLYQSESTQLVKMSKLTDVAVNPKPIERQRVSTCLKVFSQETASALKLFPDLTNVDGTVIFLERFIEFWNILNVKDKFAGVRSKDPNRHPITSDEDPRLQILLEIASLAEDMASLQGKRVKQLTRDTAMSLSHTCRGLVELCKQLINNHGFDYVLFGKLTTDYLEKVFGKLRQGSGGTYFITVQGVLEKVGIMKTKLLLNLNHDPSEVNVECGHSCSKCGFLLTEEMCEIFHDLPNLERSLNIDTKMALIYIAGYIVRNDPETDDSYTYFDKYGSFTEDLNRGGLKIPGDSVCQWTFFSYIMFKVVVDNVCRKSLANILVLISEMHMFNMSKYHSYTMANILFNNHCHLYSPRSSKEPNQKLLKLMS